MEDKNVVLSTKPGASLHVSILRKPDSDTLVVFLNGLALPSGAWIETVDQLLNLRAESNQPVPSLLCYDRYGQGKSDSDPSDPPGSPYGHDLRTSVADLDQLLAQISQEELQRRTPEDLRLIFVCNSIGVALARLYAAEHPGRVEAYLFLDSIVAHTDFISIFPDPDEPGFDESKLPEDVTADDLRHARTKFRQFFHPSLPNSEKLDRRQLKELLPRADGPALPDGSGGRPPLLVVVGHDFDTFAEQCEHVSRLRRPTLQDAVLTSSAWQGPLSVSKAVINRYMNPAWASYNEGLTRLTKVKGAVKIASKCGHFIQKDDPAFVAAEINTILNALEDCK